MAAPSGSPPRRPPLGPLRNLPSELATRKPAPGKENIRPRPSFAISTRANPTTTPAATLSPPQTTPSTIGVIVSATLAHLDDTTIDTRAADETTLPVIRPVSLPPWRQQGAFDTYNSDTEDEESTSTKNDDDDEDTSRNDNAKVADNADELTSQFEPEVAAIDFTSLGVIPRELNACAVDLDADPELDYGDEFHDLLQ